MLCFELSNESIAVRFRPCASGLKQNDRYTILDNRCLADNSW